MAFYFYDKPYTEEQIDALILEMKEKDRQTYLEYCDSNKDKSPPFRDEDGKICHNAEYLNFAGVGVFYPETETEFDCRMAAWKERIKYDSVDGYLEKMADAYVTFFYERGCKEPVVTKGNIKEFPHYHLIANRELFGDALIDLEKKYNYCKEAGYLGR